MDRYYLISRITTLFQGARKVGAHAESNHHTPHSRIKNSVAAELTSADIYHGLMNISQTTAKSSHFLDPYNFFSK